MSIEPAVAPPPTPGRGSVWEVLRVFLKLGLTSFGGPIAHLGYFRDELVTRKKWLQDEEYADLVALHGNPLADITRVQQIDFVMKNGTVYKSAK